MTISKRRRSDYVAIGLFLASLTVVIGFGLLLRSRGNGPLWIDIWWHDLVGASERSPAFFVATVLAQMGSALGVALCGVLIAVLLFYREFRRRSPAWERWRDSCTLITAMLIGVLCSETIKHFIARPRPVDALLHPTGYSYPSGHSMGAAVLVVSLVLIASGRVSRTAARWVALGAVAWVLAMMWSRAALHVHWLSDTLAGALLGIAAAALAHTIWRGSGGSQPLIIEDTDRSERESNDDPEEAA